jgi:hypothetical protein
VLPGAEPHDVRGGRVQLEPPLRIEQQVALALPVEAEPRLGREPGPALRGDQARPPAGPRPGSM